MPMLRAVLAEKRCSGALGALGMAGVACAAVCAVSSDSEPTQVSWGIKESHLKGKLPQ